MVDAAERCSLRRRGVPGPQTNALAALDETHPEPAQLEQRWLTTVAVGLEADSAPTGDEAMGLSARIGQGDRAGVGRAIWQHDIHPRAGPDAIHAGSQPVQAGQREPAHLAPQGGIAL